jgi:hypothetical protein
MPARSVSRWVCWPQAEIGVVAVEYRGELLAVQGCANSVEPGVVQAGERLAVPQCQCLVHLCRGVLVVVTGVCLGTECAEAVQVDGGRIGFDQVAASVSGQAEPGCEGECSAQFGHVGIHRVGGPGRWVVGPDSVDQRVECHEAVCFDEQYREQCSLSGKAQINSLVVEPDLDRAK